jgi:hypothetical protein
LSLLPHACRFFNDAMFVTHTQNEKCGLKKYVIVISKLKLKNTPP